MAHALEDGVCKFQTLEWILDRIVDWTISVALGPRSRLVSHSQTQPELIDPLDLLRARMTSHGSSLCILTHIICVQLQMHRFKVTTCRFKMNGKVTMQYEQSGMA